MGFLDNAVNKSVPQASSLAKPLLLALARYWHQAPLPVSRRATPGPGTSPAADPQAGGLLEAWVDCSRSSSRAVKATWLNHGSGAGKISRSRRVNLARRSVRHLSKRWPKKTGMSEQDVTAQLSNILPGFVDKLTPQGRVPTHDEIARFDA